MELEREHLDILVSDQANHPDIKQIQENLVRYVESHVGPSTFRELTITLKDSSGALIAGLNGQTNWQWLFIKMVYVSDGHRYQGLGTKLLKAAEHEARRRSCAGVWLDTFSFQSPDFYRKHGYSEIGKIDNYPYGHQRLFYYKNI